MRELGDPGQRSIGVDALLEGRRAERPLPRDGIAVVPAALLGP